MKHLILIISIFISTIIFGQGNYNLNNIKGFKEIIIGENIRKYEKNINKIDKTVGKYSGIPKTNDDIFLYLDSNTQTIFGLKILNVFIVSDFKNTVSQIGIVLAKPDTEKIILSFLESEFGNSYLLINNEKEQTYLWAGDEVALKLNYTKGPNKNLYCTINYIPSFKKLRKDH